MCTLVLLRRPDHPWPLILAANRDEMEGRPWLPPGRHWPDRDTVVAGLDELAGGTWLGLNDQGVVAGVLNRTGTLGPLAGKRSRGELPLEALDHFDAVAAADAMRHLDPRAWRPFNLVIADNRDAYWLRSDGNRITAIEIPAGVSMLTSKEMNDPDCPRIETYLPRFRAAAPPEPNMGYWESWEALLASGHKETPTGGNVLSLARPDGFGTRSGSLIALPAMDRPEIKPVWRFCGGRPGAVPYQAIAL